MIRNPVAVVLALTALSACASEVVENKAQYYGCYTLEGRPVLSISAEQIMTPDGDSTSIQRFVRMKGKDYVVSTQSVSLREDGTVRIGSGSTGFQYYFRSTPERITMMAAAERGPDIAIIKHSASPCSWAAGI
jgi:hypothetical protein